jgi:hypothetical protein
MAPSKSDASQMDAVAAAAKSGDVVYFDGR